MQLAQCKFIYNKMGSQNHLLLYHEQHVLHKESALSQHLRIRQFLSRLHLLRIPRHGLASPGPVPLAYGELSQPSPCISGISQIFNQQKDSGNLDKQQCLHKPVLNFHSHIHEIREFLLSFTLSCQILKLDFRRSMSRIIYKTNGNVHP